MNRAFAVLLLFAACAAPPPMPLRRPVAGLDADVRAVVRDLGPNVRAAVWLSAPAGPPAFAWNVDQPMPTASAIKAAYLVELFAEFADNLEAPFPDADKLLSDAAHPAVRDFPAAQRATARKALSKASVRAIGEAMITGKGVDNATYNLAANLVTAHFGGPAWLEARLHQRDPSWQGLHVRRYMLANREEHGDNEATARSLAAVHGLLATGHARGVPDSAIAAARAVLARPDDDGGRHHFQKAGALDSDPVTRTVGGFTEGPSGKSVYVIMLAQDDLPTADFAAAGQKLGAAVDKIEAMLLAAAP
jgi:hypothetical protein